MKPIILLKGKEYRISAIDRNVQYIGSRYKFFKGTEHLFISGDIRRGGVLLVIGIYEGNFNLDLDNKELVNIREFAGYVSKPMDHVLLCKGGVRRLALHHINELEAKTQHG